MENHDVLVVGGGPAGSSCAGRLVAASMKVLLLDKKPFPRDKPCAGWITPQVVQELRLDVDDYRQGRVWQTIRGFRTGVIGGGEVEVRYPRPISFGIRRCEFDTYLLRRSGAACRLGEPVRSILRRDDRWVINDRYVAPLLVGAGGHFCPVAQRLGARRDRTSSVVRAQEAEFEATPDQLRSVEVRAEVPELFFCEDLQGYGWFFRKGNFLNIGLGRLDGGGLRDHVSRFCDYLRRRGKIRGEISARFAGHAYQLYERRDPILVDDGIVLVGDAAGLAYPRSGEGIRPAVESGLLAAETIVAAAGGYRHEDLAPYAQRILSRFGAPRRDGPAGWMPAAWLRQVASHLITRHWFAKNVVMDRWFLHAHQAALEPDDSSDPAPVASA